MKNMLRKGSLRGTVGVMALLTLVAWTLLVLPGQALAVPSIDFEQGSTTGGTLTIVGVHVNGSTVIGEHAIGTNIPLSVAKLIDTPANAGTYSMTAYLDFNTGFGGSGSSSITVTGWIPALGVGSASNPVTLLSGSFNNFSITAISNHHPDGSFSVSGFLISGEGPDVKHPELVAAAGLPSDTTWKFFGFTFSSLTGEFSIFPEENIAELEGGVAVSVDLLNTVPEPSALLLMGAALAGLGLWGYRKRVTSRV